MPILVTASYMSPRQSLQTPTPHRNMKLWEHPADSYVFFWLSHVLFFFRGCNMLPEKQLHRSLQDGFCLPSKAACLCDADAGIEATGVGQAARRPPLMSWGCRASLFKTQNASFQKSQALVSTPNSQGSYYKDTYKKGPQLWKQSNTCGSQQVCWRVERPNR